MKKRSFLIIFIAILILTGSAQAQSGGDYDLSWSTVDGGGYTWSAGVKLQCRWDHRSA